MQRIVARPSSARVAVPMPVELHYSPISTELAMRSLQNIGKEEEIVGRVSNETSWKVVSVGIKEE